MRIASAESEEVTTSSPSRKEKGEKKVCNLSGPEKEGEKKKKKRD